MLQSRVTPLDVNEGNATLAFLEGSHRLHKKFGVEQEITNNAVRGTFRSEVKDDWYKLSDEQVIIYTEEFTIVNSRE